MNIKPTAENLNQGIETKLRERDSRRRYPHGRENFAVKVKDPKGGVYEIRYYF